MALVIGNKTYSLSTPASSLTVTVAHTQNVGADGYLFVVLHMNTSASVSGITYNGVALTQFASVLPSTYSTTWQFWKLASPTTGSNNLVVTLASNQWNPLSLQIFSVTGSAGNGSVLFDNTAPSPNTGSISVSANSYVWGGGLTGSATAQVITIDGSSRPLDYTHNINNYTTGSFSLQLTAGSKTTSISGTTDVAANFFEILESGGGGGIKQGNFLPFFYQ
jgi:hypothetical protein